MWQRAYEPNAQSTTIRSQVGVLGGVGGAGFFCFRGHHALVNENGMRGVVSSNSFRRERVGVASAGRTELTDLTDHKR